MVSAPPPRTTVPRATAAGLAEPPPAARRRRCAQDDKITPDGSRRGRRLRRPTLSGRAASLLGRAIHLGRVRAAISRASCVRRRRRIENAVDRLVFRTCLPDDDTANAHRRQVRYREHRASLFVFLDRSDVPPTNNASGQDLRPSVIHRTSLLTTARKRGESFLDALCMVAGPSPLQAVPTLP